MVASNKWQKDIHYFTELPKQIAEFEDSADGAHIERYGWE